MLEGVIVSNISNVYIVEAEDKIYECNAKGKFKNIDITPVVGDKVNIEVLDKDKNTAIVSEILERKNYIKRPKIANLAKLILVLSAKQPKPDLLMLDKQIAFAEFLNLDICIVINKIDLEKEEKINEIKKIYTDIGYKVIITNAKIGEGTDKLNKELLNSISAFSGNSGVRKI